jgi:uncharacterized protein YggE
MIVAVTLALLSLAAADGDTPSPRIVIQGSGEVRTPPDVATVFFEVSAERAKPDEATANLAATQKAFVAGVVGFVGGAATVETGRIHPTG